MPTKKPPHSPTKAILYARVSTDQQATEGTSLDDQVSRGKAFALSQGWTLDRIFIESGESGKSTDREAFQDMVSYIQDTPPEVLLVFKLDRLFRNLKDLLIFIDDELDPRNTSLVSVSESFDTGSPQGRLFLQMLGSFAEFERSQIVQRTMAGKIATAKAGKWNGGHVPWGYYRKIEDSEFDFDIDPQTGPIVKQIFRLYSRGKGYLKIKKLTGCTLTVKAIADLIQSPFYCGKVKYDGIISDNNHLPIISEKLFRKCQKVRAGKLLAA